MKNIGTAAVLVGGLAAAALGLAFPAQAVPGGDRAAVSLAAPEFKGGLDRLNWLDEIRPKVSIPKVDTDVRHREIVRSLP